MLAAATALSLVSCGGKGGENATSSAPPADAASATPTVEPEEAGGPGRYEAASLYSDSSYVLNENGSYEHGEEKGIYTVEADGSLIMQPKDSDSSQTLTACGNYYHTETGMSEDTEYGMAPTFDENGHSSQTFVTAFDADDPTASMTLELHEDGTFAFSIKQSSSDYLLMRLEDVVDYSGTYTLEEEVLRLSYHNADFTMLFADGKIYPITYVKRTDANDAEIENAQAVILETENTARQGRWWTPVDDSLAAEITSHLTGRWEWQERDEFGLTSMILDIDEESISRTYSQSTFGITTVLFAKYQICNGAILLRLTDGMNNFRSYEAIPYSYTDGTLTLYETNNLNDGEDKNPAFQFVTEGLGQFTKTE